MYVELPNADDNMNNVINFINSPLEFLSHKLFMQISLYNVSVQEGNTNISACVTKAKHAEQTIVVILLPGNSQLEVCLVVF